MVVVLFSSGLDSWACLNWAVQKYGPSNVLPLYIDFGQCYAEKEIAHASDMCESLFTWSLHIKKLPKDLLFEHPETKHVPFRNTVFLLIAAMFDNVEAIVFGMIRGDWSEDKNPKYVHNVQKLINSQLVPTIHRPRGEVKLLTPFARYTKTEVVKWLLENTDDGVCGIKATIGCYSGGEACGQCISCFSRWVAFTLNNITSEHKPNVYVQWLLSQFGSEKVPKLKWRMLQLAWRKRAFILDARKALNFHCRKQFDRSFLSMYLFT